MIEQKFERLKELILKQDSLLVAFSGGIDSSFLLKIAHDLLGQKAAGCTAISPTLPHEERKVSIRIANEIGANHFFVEYDELAIPGYSANHENRCYLCKTELFTHLKKAALEHGFRSIAYGANHDDLKEFRPGMKAAQEFHVSAPLLDAGLTKDEIRQLSRKLGLSIWNKPALACLSSRIPFGTEITHRRLTEVEKAESILRNAGLNQVRVRHHDSIARIEVSPEEMGRLLEPERKETIIQALKQIGFKYITMDLEGYRPGGLVSPQLLTIGHFKEKS